MHNLIDTPHPEQGPYAPILRGMCERLWRFARETGDSCVNPYIMTALAPYGPGILRDGPG